MKKFHKIIGTIVLACLLILLGRFSYFLDYDLKEKRSELVPQILFHGSENRNIEILEPQIKRRRKGQTNPVVYATPHISFASIFLSRHDDRWTKIGQFDKGPFYLVCKDKERFISEDNGGAIYFLPAYDFDYDVTKGMGITEWEAGKPVKPIYKLEFDSALDIMLSFGVQVYFVDEDTFKRIEASNDNGLHILQSLESENQKRNVNVILLLGHN